MTQTENGTVGGYGHGDDHGVDMDHGLGESDGAAEIEHRQGNDQQAHEGGEIDGAVTQHHPE